MKKFLFMFCPFFLVGFSFLSSASTSLPPDLQIPQSIIDELEARPLVWWEDNKVELTPEQESAFYESNADFIKSYVNSNGKTIEFKSNTPSSINGLDFLLGVQAFCNYLDIVDNAYDSDDYQAFKFKVKNSGDSQVDALLDLAGIDSIIAIDYYLNDVFIAVDESGTVLDIYSKVSDTLIEFSDAILGIDDGIYSTESFEKITTVGCPSQDAVICWEDRYSTYTVYHKDFNFFSGGVAIATRNGLNFYSLTPFSSVHPFSYDSIVSYNSNIIRNSRTSGGSVVVNGKTIYTQSLVYNPIYGGSSTSQIFTRSYPDSIFQPSDEFRNESEYAAYLLGILSSTMLISNYDNNLPGFSTSNWYPSSSTSALQSEVESGKTPNRDFADSFPPFIYPITVGPLNSLDLGTSGSLSPDNSNDPNDPNDPDYPDNPDSDLGVDLDYISPTFIGTWGQAMDIFEPIFRIFPDQDRGEVLYQIWLLIPILAIIILIIYFVINVF